MSSIRKRVRCVFVLGLALSGCSSGETPRAPGAGSAVAPWRAECETCLASGKNWTAHLCKSDCMLDTWCYGPGNPASASCPKNEPDDTVFSGE